jgi:hypothetical protein
MVGMEERERSHTGKALGMVGLGLAAVVAVALGALHALSPGDVQPVSATGDSPAVTQSAARPTRPATMPSETGVTEVAEGGYGGDAQQNDFFDWAAQHRVGSLNLPGMDASTGELERVATGYCDLLSDEPGGSGADVTRMIRLQTGATKSMSQELLERSVAAFCPQKARHLV